MAGVAAFQWKRQAGSLWSAHVHSCDNFLGLHLAGTAIDKNKMYLEVWAEFVTSRYCFGIVGFKLIGIQP